MSSNKILSSIVIMLSIMNVNAFWEQIPTGSVGISYRLKKLDNYIYDSGFHWYNPILYSMREMNIRPQVDEIRNIHCTTKDGLNIVFPTTKVWNQLSKENVIEIVGKYGEEYDNYIVNQPVQQQILEMCNEMVLSDIYIEEFSDLNEKILDYLIEYQISIDSKLSITKVALSKPEIPLEIKKNYEQITIEKTAILAEDERQKRRLKEEETNRMIEEQQKLKEKSLAELENLKMISNAEAQAKKAQIEYEADSHKKKSEADVQSYEKKSQAEANAKLYTPEYIQVHYQQHVLANTDATYFGKDLPQAYIMGPQINK